MNPSIFVDWNYDMEPLEPNDAELIAAAIASGYEPENVDKTPTDEDGDQPVPPEPREWDGVTVR